MSLLSDLTTLIGGLQLPVQTVSFEAPLPTAYAVLTPLSDSFDVFADDKPEQNIEEVRISLFDKGNYNAKKNQLVSALVTADYTITARQYVGREDDTGYHHYAIDVAKNYDYTEVT